MAEASPWATMRARATERGDAAPDVDEDTVDRLWRAAVEAWPTLDLSVAAFVETLERVLATLPPGTEAASLAAADLALAAQCLAGDNKAIARLDVVIDEQARRVTATMRLEANEVAQLARVHLLTAPAGVQPRLAQYSGRSTLSSWVRIVAGRLALNEQRARAPVVGTEFCEPIAQSTPELNALHAERQARFADAFRGAYRARSSEERHILKRYFVAKETLAQLGAELGVHTSTAARRLTAARSALLEDFHGRLGTLAGVDETQAKELLSILQSRLDLSDASLMRTTEPDP